MKSDRALAVAILTLALATGCRSSHSSSAAFDEQRVARELEFQDHGTVVESSGRWHEIVLANTGSTAQSARCALEWYDATGATIPLGVPDWQAVHIGPGDSQTLRFQPGPAAAASWRLRFRAR